MSITYRLRLTENNMQSHLSLFVDGVTFEFEFPAKDTIKQN